MGAPEVPWKVEAAKNLHSQALFAKFFQHGFTQKIGIEFAGFCKFDNSLGNHFIGEIASLGKPKSDVCHFECDGHDPPGLGIEAGIVQKLGDGHGLPVKLAARTSSVTPPRLPAH
jgi:hypothetical protein